MRYRLRSAIKPALSNPFSTRHTWRMALFMNNPKIGSLWTKLENSHLTHIFMLITTQMAKKEMAQDVRCQWYLWILRPCKRRPAPCFVVSQNSKDSHFQNFWNLAKILRFNCFFIYVKKLFHICEYVTKLIVKLRLHFRPKTYILRSKMYILRLRTCKRCLVLRFVVSQYSKHASYKNFECIKNIVLKKLKIVLNFLQNTHSDLNFNQYTITITVCRALVDLSRKDLYQDL